MYVAWVDKVDECFELSVSALEIEDLVQMEGEVKD